MKFMQKTKEKMEEKEQVKSVFGSKAGDEGSGDQKREHVWQTEESHAACEGLLFGRISFRGYNADVERLMTEKRGGSLPRAETEEESVDVTASEMLTRVQVGQATSQSSNSRSGQVKRKRSHYIRPLDDS